MDTNKLLLIFLISLGSLIWGAYDLNKKKDKGTVYNSQSYLQIIAGIVGLLVGVYYLLQRLS